jgi:hypothetical protein
VVLVARVVLVLREQITVRSIVVPVVVVEDYLLAVKVVILLAVPLVERAAQPASEMVAVQQHRGQVMVVLVVVGAVPTYLARVAMVARAVYMVVVVVAREPRHRERRHSAQVGLVTHCWNGYRKESKWH